MFGRVTTLGLCLLFGSTLVTGDARSAPRPDAPRGIILTSRELAPAFRRLAAFESGGGVDTRVVTLDAVLASAAPGRDVAERVRNYLKVAHADGLEWLLVGGGPEVIPMRAALPNRDFDPVPTDLYYAALAGDWDANGNGIFGEISNSPVDDPDLVPDLHVGRAPVATADEARRFVRNTLAAYASAPDGRAPGVALVGEIEFPYPWSPGQEVQLDAADRCEAVAAGLAPGAPGPIARLYENPARFGPGVTPLDRASFLAELAAGPRLVFDFGRSNGHQISAGVDLVQPEDLFAVDMHGSPQFFFTSGSIAGNPLPGSPVRGLVLAPRGACAGFIGPTTSLPINGQTSFLASLAVGMGMAPDARVGELKDATLDGINEFGFQRFRPDERMAYTLFGDPQLPMHWAGANATLASPGNALAAAPSVAVDAMLRPGAPGRVRVALGPAGAGRAVVASVFDVRGRCVRELGRATVDATGEARFAWDRRDAAGRGVGPGVYFVAVTQAGQRGVARCVVLAP